MLLEFKKNRMSLSKTQIKKAIALGEEFNTKFMAKAAAMGQGHTEAVIRVLDTLMSKYWPIFEEIGNFDVYVDNDVKVMTWEGMTREQFKYQISIALFTKVNKL